MRRSLIVLLIGLLLGAVGVARAQQDPEDFTPQGYEFCGWKPPGEGWTQ